MVLPNPTVCEILLRERAAGQTCLIPDADGVRDICIPTSAGSTDLTAVRLWSVWLECQELGDPNGKSSKLKELSRSGEYQRVCKLNTAMQNTGYPNGDPEVCIDCTLWEPAQDRLIVWTRVAPWCACQSDSLYRQALFCWLCRKETNTGLLKLIIFLK